MYALPSAHCADRSARRDGAQGNAMQQPWFRFFRCCERAGPDAARFEYVDNL